MEAEGRGNKNFCLNSMPPFQEMRGIIKLCLKANFCVEKKVKNMYFSV